MTYSVEFEMTWNWIMRHASDEVGPMVSIQNYFTEFENDKIRWIRNTVNKFEIYVSDEMSISDIKETVCKFFREHFDDFTEDCVSCIDKGKVDDDNEIDEMLEDLIAEIDKVNDEAKEPSQHQTTESEQILQLIDSDIGGEEFKVLAHEAAILAPQLIANKTQHLFLQQSYLFSVNEGCGLTRQLFRYMQLIGKLNIAGLVTQIMYIKLLRKADANDKPCDEVCRQIATKLSRQSVCIDICDWMNDVRTAEFQQLLSRVKDICRDAIVVFRIPFVDKEVLNNVTKALNDVMFIRPVSIPPYTIEQVDQLAKQNLQQYGFDMEQSAWKNFNARIREESSDGRFYGENTISKVVSELLYRKQLCNAKKNSDSKTITAEDTKQLCSLDYVEGKTGLEMLDGMVGTESIKQRLLEIISQIEFVRSDKTLGNPCIHMRFLGNPGTGKTTVARIVGKILQEKGILRVGDFFEHSGRDFCGRYIGETAPKTMSMCREAYGSVLFIDEAYTLYKGPDDYKDFGREALDTLIAEMENHRKDLVVIMAGYTDDMERLLKGNAGLESRMPYTIEFPNFTREQLYRIFVNMASKMDLEEGLLQDVKAYFDNLDENFVSAKEFSNARYVRNLYERTCAKAVMRCQLEDKVSVTLVKEDFGRAIADKEFANVAKNKRRTIGFGN